MLKTISIALLAGAAAVATSVVRSDELPNAVEADPDHYTVEFENDRVRIIRVKYGPGEKSVLHTHGPNVGVFVTDIEARMHAPDGSHEDVSGKAGDAAYYENEAHQPENIGDEAFEVVLVEFKD